MLVAGVLARIAWNPAIVGLKDVGTTPIFNWLLWGYGIPAAAFWLGGHLLRRRADDAPARMADSAALLFAVLLAFLEVRHYMTGGDIYRTSSGLDEIALHVNVGLAMTIGLEWLRQRTHSIIHNVGALIIAALTLAAIVFGLGFAGNPMIWRVQCRRQLLQPDPARLRAAGAADGDAGARHPRPPAGGLQPVRRGDRGGARARLSLAAGAPLLPRRRC